MVEGARLESGCALQRGTEGSNPSHSAADMTEEDSRRLQRERNVAWHQG